jgi:hypothetical protein
VSDEQTDRNEAALGPQRAAIIEALRVARATRNWRTPELRSAIERYATQARAIAYPPERLIVELKALLREDALAHMGDWFRDVLTDRAVTWAVEAYFRISPADSDEAGGNDPS